MKNFLSTFLFLYGFAGVAKSLAAQALLVVEQAGARLSSFNSVSGKRLGSVPLELNPHEIEVSPDGRTAYVSNFGIQDYDENIGTPGRSVSKIDLLSMRELRKFSTGRDAAPHGLKLRPPQHHELYVNAEKGHTLIVFDVESGRALRKLAIDRHTHNFVFSENGKSLFLMAGPNGIIEIDSESGAELSRFGLGSPARGLAYSPDKKSLLVAGKGELGIFNVESKRLETHFSDLGVGQILYAGFTSDGARIVAPAVWDSQVLVIDVVTKAVVKRIVTGLDPVSVVVKGDTAFVSNARSRHVSCIDLNTYHHTKCVSALGPNGLAFGRAPLNPERARPDERADTLRFGVPLPLSGRESYFGREMLMGYEYWKEGVNDDGGIRVGGKKYQVDVLYRDTHSDNSRVAELARELVGEGVQYFLGTYNTPANGALAAVAQAGEVPLVTAAGAGRSLYEQKNPWIFGIMSPASDYLKGTIEFFAKHSSDLSRVAFVARNAPAPLEDAKAALKLAQEKGLSVLPELSVFATMTSSFAELVAGLKAQSVDAVVFAGDLSDAEAFVKEASLQKFNAKAFSFSVGPSLPRFSAPQGTAHHAAYMMGATQWSAEAGIVGSDRYLSSKNFQRVFWDRYFTPANYLNAGAVASGLSFEVALQQAGETSPHRVRHELRGLDINTFYGRVRFDENGLNATKPVYTIQLLPDGLLKMKEVLVYPDPSHEVVWPFPGFR